MSDYIRNTGIPPQNGETEGYFCRFTFGQFFALLVIEVFTLFFAFYLGARYGPEFLGLKKNAQIAIEETKVPTTADAEVAAMAKDLVEKAQTPELKERLQEMLSKAGLPTQVAPTQGSPTQESPTQRTAENVQPPAVAQTPPIQPTEGTREQQSATQKETDPTAKVYQPEAKEVEQGAVRIKSAENAKYSLQIGSYDKMSEANSAIERWKSKGYPAYLMIADIPDRGRWYRVRIGGFATRDEARKYQVEFEDEEAIDTLVVMNEQ